MEYESAFAPSDEIISAIDHGLHRHNVAHLGKEVIDNYAHVAVVARDEEGEIVGGIHGDLVWDWLYIRTLWVDEAYRGEGIGTQLLEQIEAIAISKGFYHSHLETTDFQALAFYRKNGYTTFGQLEDKPKGTTWYYIKKNLI